MSIERSEIHAPLKRSRVRVVWYATHNGVRRMFYRKNQAAYYETHGCENHETAYCECFKGSRS